MTELRDNSNRAKAVVTAFYFYLGMAVIALFMAFYEYHAFSIYGYTDEAELILLLFSIFRLGQFVMVVVLVVLYILWFRRAYANLHRMGINYLAHTDLHAAWCWFVPILKLFRPFQIMKEIWQETQHQINKLNPGVEVNKSNSLIEWWWGLYIIVILVGNYGQLSSYFATYSEEFQQAELFLIASQILELPSIIIAILVVKKVNNQENLLLHEYEAKDFGNQDEDVNLEEE